MRLGTVLLGQGGLPSSEGGDPRLAEVEDLPYNVIFVKGERAKAFAGGGTRRLVDRLERSLAGAG